VCVCVYGCVCVRYVFILVVLVKLSGFAGERHILVDCLIH
jgi:hypothetical protein